MTISSVFQNPITIYITFKATDKQNETMLSIIDCSIRVTLYLGCFNGIIKMMKFGSTQNTNYNFLHVSCLAT